MQLPDTNGAVNRFKESRGIAIRELPEVAVLDTIHTTRGGQDTMFSLERQNITVVPKTKERQLLCLGALGRQGVSPALCFGRSPRGYRSKFGRSPNRRSLPEQTPIGPRSFHDTRPAAGPWPSARKGLRAP